jgi:hypothetical protein
MEMEMEMELKTLKVDGRQSITSNNKTPSFEQVGVRIEEREERKGLACDPVRFWWSQRSFWDDSKWGR